MSSRRYVPQVPTDYQRARSPEAKAERRHHVLRVAREMLWTEGDLRALSLNALARRAGMAKSNVYRYFETREAVLLALLLDEWRAWADSAAVPSVAMPSERTVVRHVAATLAERPLLCLLTAALPTVLEQNLSVAAITAFKRDALALLRSVGERLAAQAPALGADAWAAVLYDACTLITGLYPVTRPAPPAAAALADPALAFFRRELGPELARHLEAVAVAGTSTAGC